MKQIFRNIFHIFRHFKLATILNLFGLSIAFAVFVIIMMQVQFDRTFDEVHQDRERIYRMEVVLHDEWQSIINRPFAEIFVNSSSHIEQMMLFNPWQGSYYIYVLEGEEKHYHELRSYSVSPSITTIFSFEFIEGDEHAMEKPNHVIISESQAKKMFNDQLALNQQLQISESSFLTVGGVYKDFPKNSTFKNDMYVPIPETENIDRFDNFNYQCYFKMTTPQDPDKMIEEMLRNFDHSLLNIDEEEWVEEMFSGLRFRLTPLEEVYYLDDVLYDWGDRGSHQKNALLILISIVIIAIATINYTNFSTALSPMRMKSINTQRVYGGKVSQIRIMIILEAVIMALLSLGVAIFIVFLMKDTFVQKIIMPEISWQGNEMIIIFSGVVSVIVGLIAGLYPAFYMTSFSPALVLKGSFGLSLKGRKLRAILLGFQFTISIALLIVAIFMQLQNQYMINDERGFDVDKLIVAYISGSMVKQRDVVTEKLLANKNIEKVGYSSVIINNSDNYMRWGRDNEEGENVNYTTILTLPGSMEAMGIAIIEGRDFVEEDRKGEAGAYLFNETAKKKYNLKLGDNISGSNIVGFFSDIKFSSYRSLMEPQCFYVFGEESDWGESYRACYIKVKNEELMNETLLEVDEIFQTFNNVFPVNAQLLREMSKNAYQNEKNLASLLQLFTLITIIISLVGVFGLVIFEIEYRRKEIGIRKVFGASTQSVLLILNKMYLTILAISFVIAVPIAYYFAAKWFANFAFHIPLYWWIAPIALIIIALITFSTVTIQSWRAANENPVYSINS